MDKPVNCKVECQKQASGIEHVRHIHLDALHSVLITKQVFFPGSNNEPRSQCAQSFVPRSNERILFFQSLTKLREERIETI